jgi:exopolyphosphatase/guanosine-5'-triphosphate,3'-diphosphate pyrophosphatase
LVDVGSNAVRTRIVEVTSEGSTTLHDERTALRVGAEVFVSGALTKKTIDGVAQALGRFRSRCDRLGVRDIRAVATSAARSARNGDELVRAVRAAGVDLTIIDGDQEALLLRAAVGRRCDLRHGRAVLVDLGAGSLEVVVLEAGAQLSSASYPLGSLRLYDTLAPADRDVLGVPLLAALDALIAARGAPATDQLHAARGGRLLGVGSSIDVVADLETQAGRGVTIDGLDAVTTAALMSWRAQLAALPPTERTRQFGLTADRADLVVVALSVYAWLVQQLAADAVLVPRVSLRDGLLAQWLAEPV